MNKETKTRTTEWVVARLNYAEPWDDFLTKSLKPFANSLVQAGIVERYFWQRGYERGAHILLTMRAESRTLYELILPSLNDHFNMYVEDLPSMRVGEDFDLEPNNTIQTAIYQPIESDWGGIVGMPIIERFQQASSEAVLNFMYNKSDTWSPVEALATAIELHLGFVDSSGMKIDDAIQFFEFCLMQHVKEPFSFHLFEYIFKKQEKPLFQFHAKVWSALKTGSLFSERHYNRYLEQCYYTAEDLKLTLRHRTLDVKPQLSELWKLYARFLGETNLRLGLRDRHELLLYYAIFRSLEKVKDSEL